MVEGITSRENAAIKRVGKLLHSAKYRRQEAAFIVEGVRLCRDAVQSHMEIRECYYTKQALQKYGRDLENILQRALRSSLVSDSVMSFLTDTQSPQGILCVCAMLDKTECAYKMDINGPMLVLEDIQDPSNLGTILRTAEALGIAGVYMSKGCCDVYSPKVLRGSMGAVFRVPFYIMESLPEAICNLRVQGYSVYAGVPDSQALPITRIQHGVKTAVAVGNEGNGLTQSCIHACTAAVTIPMLGRAESLNAATAAAIMLWEMMRSGTAT